MPPKRESCVSSNNVSSNETLTSTSFTNNILTTASQGSTSITAAAAANSNSNNNTSPTTTAVAANALPVLMVDTAAEQRTVAYQANAKLCRLVRKCPWMYDRNHHNYAKKHILDKSWCKIARECNDSVASCKERWRNIRAAFARSINIYKTHSGPNRVKPYYLYNELSFLVKPMMEGRDKKDDYDETQEGVSGGGGAGVKDEDNCEEDAAEEDDDEEEEPAEEEEDFPDVTEDIKSAFEALNPDIRIQEETRFQKLFRYKTNNNNNNNNISNNNYSNNNNNNNTNDFDPSCIFEPHTECNTNSDAENDFQFQSDEALSPVEPECRLSRAPNHNVLKRPAHVETESFENKRLKLSSSTTTQNENDIRFLEALLPDMALMNTRQKIVFKRKIYQTLEEVFENSNDFPNVEHNKVEHNTANTTANNLANAQINPNPNNFYNNTNMSTQAQVRQTVLTVNSSTARSLINNIANLNEAELQKVNSFLQNSLRNQQLVNGRINNNHNGIPSSAAAKLMSSTPKITITKVACPPPAALRNLSLAKPSSPSPATVSTTIHNPSAAVISSNVHSTTSSNPTKASTIQNSTTAQHSNSTWSQLLPITIKDEIEDVDIV